jgi:hypothetical protein
MPTGADHIPDDGTGLARRIIALERQLRTLRPTSGIPLTDLTLANGWTPAGGTWASPQALRRADGVVQLLGTLTPGTLTGGTTILAVPWAPASDLEWRVGGGAGTTSADLYLLAGSGALTIQNIAGTVSRISLNAISFPSA